MRALFFVIDSPVMRVKAGWKDGYDHMASITRVETLAIPLTWNEMRAEKRLKDAGFLNGAMVGLALRFYVLARENHELASKGCINALLSFFLIFTVFKGYVAMRAASFLGFFG